MNFNAYYVESADPSGRSLTGTAGSNLAGGMDVFLWRVVCIVK